MLRPLFSDLRDLSIVVGTPFLYVNSTRTLILADTHFGFEEAASMGLFYSLRRSGGYYAVFVPRIQFKKTTGMLDLVFSNLEVNRVVINGDLKHAFDRLLKQERDEVVKLVEFLRGRGVYDIVVIRGNHDNFIRPVLRKLDVDFVNAISINVDGKRVLVLHGHERYDISEHDIVIIGHEHPSLRCFDVYKFPCFMKLSLPGGKRLVVMPATSPYHPGVSVSPVTTDYLSPFIRDLNSLDDMSIVFWVELGELTERGVEYMQSASDLGIVRIDKYVVGTREYATVEFSDYKTAYTICQI